MNSCKNKRIINCIVCVHALYWALQGDFTSFFGKLIIFEGIVDYILWVLEIFGFYLGEGGSVGVLILILGGQRG